MYFTSAENEGGKSFNEFIFNNILSPATLGTAPAFYPSRFLLLYLNGTETNRSNNIIIMPVDNKGKYESPECEVLVMVNEGAVAISDPNYNNPFEEEEDW